MRQDVTQWWDGTLISSVGDLHYCHHKTRPKWARSRDHLAMKASFPSKTSVGEWRERSTAASFSNWNGSFSWEKMAKKCVSNSYSLVNPFENYRVFSQLLFKSKWYGGKTFLPKWHFSPWRFSPRRFSPKDISPHFFSEFAQVRRFSPKDISPHDISPQKTFLPTTFLPIFLI